MYQICVSLFGKVDSICLPATKKMMKRFSLLFLFSVSIALAQQNTLQELIDRASAGDTLAIESGTYVGNIVIAKRLHLIGKNFPVIRGSGINSVVTILADSCTLSGFIVEHCGAMLVNEDAGIIIKSGYNRIEKNRLRDILFGIYFLQSNYNIVSGNSVVGRTALEQGERGSGIHIWNSNYNTFSGNTVNETRDGFYIQNANHTLIQDNEVFNLRYGLHYMYADSNAFLRNSFHDNVAGAAIMFTRGIVMKHNIFLRNRGFASYGILLQDCHEMIADSNVISDNVIGIFFESSTNNFFRNNIIARNDLALEMFQNSTKNTFSENNFIDNLNPLTIVGRTTASMWSSNGRGNYWSAYDGYDIDGDGIGDIPMKIENVFSYLEAKNANARLYLYSPAAQALAVSAKAFPILDISRERDEHPLINPVPMEWVAMFDRTTQTKKVTPLQAHIVPFMVPVIIFAIGYFLRKRRSA